MTSKTKKTLARAEKLAEKFRTQAKTEEGRSRCGEVQINAAGYAEPGYSDPDSGVVALGNWNEISRWAEGKSEKVDSAPADLAAALEKIGVDLEWEDEWKTCSDCSRLVRTQPDSYSWKRSYFEDDDCNIQCSDCVLKDPSAYLASLEGNPKKAVTIEVDLAKQGYRQVDAKFENGLYGGQAASPKLIAEALREQGIERFLFEIDSVGQFDLDFSVWIHEDEWSQFDPSKFGQAKVDGPDPAAMAQKAMREAALQPKPAGEGIVHTTLNLDDGTAKTRVVTAQEFVEKGIRPED
jgi:hypothetical protein